MRTPAVLSVFLLTLHGIAASQTINVVNLIPATLSNESNQDSETDVTYNPNNPDEIVATAFTPNPGGGTTTAPVYISQDGGATWVLNNIVPSANGNTGDITVSISRNGVLYAGILRGGGTAFDMRILRDATYTAAGAMTQLLGRTQEDQPYARAYSPMGGPQRNNDHLYVGHNDFNNSPQTASFEQSLDAETAAAPAGLATIRLERRTPSGQDGPPIRQAIHPDGTVYAVYTQRTASAGSIRTGNIVVVRDDDWGQGATPYSDVTDPSDTIAGRFVVAGVTWVWNTGAVFGQERLGDRASIAVDPGDNQTVYVAWIDRPAGVTGNTATIHVRRSTDGGNNWSADLRTINGAINPQLAVNIRGDVGLVFQQLTGTAPNQRWQTHFQQSTNGGATWADFTLANVPAGAPAPTFLPYIGDYAGLIGVGKNFYGTFAANNTPNNANFPNGVAYQRNANFGTNTLTNGVGGAVAVSIDPFFFHAQNLAENRDFYVRDWTDSATDNDVGLEPSTEPVFYNRSDVWNRRTNAAGSFTASDRPSSQDPQFSTAGSNFGFARVHRMGTGVAETVTLHFLKSELGTGSNYVNAGASPDPTLSFAAGDLVQTMTSGYEWVLNDTSSTHTCLAVEISTSNDPIVPPGLLGRAPGWPTTDLMVIYDNNKAQRNMGVYSGSGEGGSISYWAIVHNAATFRRDVVLDYAPDERFRRLFQEARLQGVGGELKREQNRVILSGMAPGENRWISLAVPASANQQEGERVSVDFFEMVGQQAVNGFTLAVDRAPIDVAAVGGLRLFATNLHRLGHLTGLQPPIDRSKDLLPAIQEEKIDPGKYVDLIGSNFPAYRDWLAELLEKHGSDPFTIVNRLDILKSALDMGNANRVYPAQWDLDHAVDAFLTYLDKRGGDVADVAQNMRWQGDLLRTIAVRRPIAGMDEVAKLSDEFDVGYAARSLTVADYSRYVENSLRVLRRLDAEMQLNQEETLNRIQSSLGYPKTLQAAHRAFLLRLDRER
ncbi:MAG TPA: sialidase family protein [Rhodothermales bacterium]